jgi:hypothetical protein
MFNKKFWEKLLTYFPWYDMDRIENEKSNNSSIAACVFVTAVTFLPSRYLAKIRAIFTEPSRYLAAIGATHTDTQTDGRDFIIRPSRWAHVPWYTYQVS